MGDGALASMQLNFLGVGGSSGMDQGSAAAVLEESGEPILLIDCGQEVPQRFQAEYGQLPPAVFITHIHMDHVSGLEPLFFATWFDAARQTPLVLFVPAPIVPAGRGRSEFLGCLSAGASGAGILVARSLV